MSNLDNTCKVLKKYLKKLFQGYDVKYISKYCNNYCLKRNCNNCIFRISNGDCVRCYSSKRLNYRFLEYSTMSFLENRTMSFVNTTYEGDELEEKILKYLKNVLFSRKFCELTERHKEIKDNNVAMIVTEELFDSEMFFRALDNILKEE